MPKQLPIATIVNNIGVEGVLTIQSSAEIHVEITEPYAGVKTAHRISFFSRLPNNANFFDTDAAIKKAESLLIMLYEGLQHAQNLHRSFADELNELDTKCADIEVLINTENIKPQLKAKLKQGEMTQTEYQRLIKFQDETNTKQRMQVSALQEKFIIHVFGEQFSYLSVDGWREFLLSPDFCRLQRSS